MYNIQLNVRGSRPEILDAQTPIRIDVLHRSEKDETKYVDWWFSHVLESLTANYMFLYASVLVLTRFDSVYCSVTMVL